MVGAIVTDGTDVGIPVGAEDGLRDGVAVVGCEVVGSTEGIEVGIRVGKRVGKIEGISVGRREIVGCWVGLTE